jgi:WhiB family redox-sensing transcriptional regulator
LLLPFRADGGRGRGEGEFVRDVDWEQHAACKGRDAAAFFGPNRFEPKRERERREAAAKAICATCPVLQPCRDHALRSGEVYGVWGGLGEVERRALLSAPAAATRSRGERGRAGRRCG